MGSSVGVSRVVDRAGLDIAVDAALAHKGLDYERVELPMDGTHLELMAGIYGEGGTINLPAVVLVLAITALLVFRGTDDATRQSAGYERVRHFRDGVINGAGSCLKDN